MEEEEDAFVLLPLLLLLSLLALLALYFSIHFSRLKALAKVL